MRLEGAKSSLDIFRLGNKTPMGSTPQYFMVIAFVIQSLGGGGAERALVNLAHGVINRGHSATIITLLSEEYDFYSLPAGATRVALDLAAKSPTRLHLLFNDLRQFIRLRRAIARVSPDIVVSFMEISNTATLFACVGTQLPVVVVEQIDPGTVDIGKILENRRRCLYPLSARVVSASKGVDRYFTWLPESKRAVIHNSLPDLDAHPGRDSSLFHSPRKKHVIAMGRLTYQKGFDMLIQSFAQLERTHPGWDLHILGEGELRPELEAQIATLGLTGRVFLPGRLANPFPMVRAADLFVLSSRFEGFGNVLIEAMACGLPVISFDCRSGPSEIIQNGVDGILVPPENVTELTLAMDYLLSNEAKREMLAAQAKKSSQRFGLEKIAQNWIELFEIILSEQR